MIEQTLSVAFQKKTLGEKFSREPFFINSKKKKFSKSIEDVLSYIEQLQEVDTEGVPPCLTVLETLTNQLREDVPEEPLSRDLFLANAPSQVGGMIKVPPVFKQQ